MISVPVVFHANACNNKKLPVYIQTKDNTSERNDSVDLICDVCANAVKDPGTGKDAICDYCGVIYPNALFHVQQQNMYPVQTIQRVHAVGEHTSKKKRIPIGLFLYGVICIIAFLTGLLVDDPIIACIILGICGVLTIALVLISVAIEKRRRKHP